MLNNQPAKCSLEPLNMGISISSPTSSVLGSSALFFAQPLLTGKVFASAAVLIGSELFLFIAKHLFNLDSIPVLDACKGQTVQMPLTDLQDFLRSMTNGSNPMTSPLTTSTSIPTSTSINNQSTILTNSDGQIDGTLIPSVVTITTPEAPLVISIYISADYTMKPFTPSVFLFIPVLTFPGIRGGIPMLILGLLSTIFVRAVVSPESTGSKPLATSGSKPNNTLTITPNDLLQLLTKYGKHFGSK